MKFFRGTITGIKGKHRALLDLMPKNSADDAEDYFAGCCGLVTDHPSRSEFDYLEVVVKQLSGSEEMLLTLEPEDNVCTKPNNERRPFRIISGEQLPPPELAAPISNERLSVRGLEALETIGTCPGEFILPINRHEETRTQNC